LENSPAETAQLQPNDQIQAVDGNSVTGQSLDEVISQVKGPAGSNVTLTIWRNGEVIDVELTRASITQESAKTNVDLDENAGYGYIDMRQSFGSETAAEFVQALSTLGAVQTLVIDLRDNPGGYLQAVSDILDLLVSKEEPYVIIEDKNGEQRPFVSKLATNANYEYVILVNENTASAAEIMTAALQQLANATVVGKQTYGKGTVQQQFELLNGGVLKLTVEKWLTPNGTSIDGVGITPDIEISPSIYYQLPSVILSETIKVGEANTQVLTTQYMLQEAGYSLSAIDGVFSEALVPVLQQFQSDQGIEITGVIDVPTANAINRILKTYLSDESHDIQLQKAIEVVGKQTS
ncbi:MAG: S41 family peptidase, partial [Culicoidibacterales bacterium]